MREVEPPHVACGLPQGDPPRILDLFAGVGGASVGYARAGFRVTGVDLHPQPDYPLGRQTGRGGAVCELVRADVPTLLTERREEIRAQFDAVHASPPCQGYLSLVRNCLPDGQARSDGHPHLYEPVREALESLGLPYAIENPASRLDVVLCGEMWGLGVIRHRRFELGGWETSAPLHVPHRGRVRGWRHGTYWDGPYAAVYGSGSRRGQGLTRPSGGGKASLAECQDAMGIDWTNDLGSIHEALPPAYTQWLGERLLEFLRREGRLGPDGRLG